MTDHEDSWLRRHDSSWASILFVGVLGTLTLVAMVFFASSLYYGMEREVSMQAGSIRSPLLDTTLTDVRVRLEGWSKRLDEETDTEHLTCPIQQAMQLVQSDLRSAQGR